MPQTLKFYRKKKDGTTVKLVIKFDQGMNILEEVESPDDRWNNNGLTLEKTAGVTKITSATPLALEINKVFTLSIPCSLPECEDIRKRYKEELDKLPENCPSCQIGALMRKYRPEVEALVKKHNPKLK